MRVLPGLVGVAVAVFNRVAFGRRLGPAPQPTTRGSMSCFDCKVSTLTGSHY